jgi:hypothetical protein
MDFSNQSLLLLSSPFSWFGGRKPGILCLASAVAGAILWLQLTDVAFPDFSRTPPSLRPNVHFTSLTFPSSRTVTPNPPFLDIVEFFMWSSALFAHEIPLPTLLEILH